MCHNCQKVDEARIKCRICNRYFRGHHCFDFNKSVTSKGNSTCRWIYRCNGCGKTVNKKLEKRHKCGKIYFAVCKDCYEEGHHCYTMPQENDFASESTSIDEDLVEGIANAKTYIFFGFECTQDDLIQCDTSVPRCL